MDFLLPAAPQLNDFPHIFLDYVYLQMFLVLLIPGWYSIFISSCRRSAFFQMSEWITASVGTNSAPVGFVDRITNWSSDINKFAGLNGDLAMMKGRQSKQPLTRGTEEKIDYDSLGLGYKLIPLLLISVPPHEATSPVFLINYSNSRNSCWINFAISIPPWLLPISHLPSLLPGSHFFFA